MLFAFGREAGELGVDRMECTHDIVELCPSFRELRLERQRILFYYGVHDFTWGL
jgi:hypothetical protein